MTQNDLIEMTQNDLIEMTQNDSSYSSNSIDSIDSIDSMDSNLQWTFSMDSFNGLSMTSPLDNFTWFQWLQ